MELDTFVDCARFCLSRCDRAILDAFDEDDGEPYVGCIDTCVIAVSLAAASSRSAWGEPPLSTVTCCHEEVELDGRPPVTTEPDDKPEENNAPSIKPRGEPTRLPDKDALGRLEGERPDESNAPCMRLALPVRTCIGDGVGDGPNSSSLSASDAFVSYRLDPPACRFVLAGG